MDQDTFDDLADVPWFADGLDDEEKALLEVLPTMSRVSPDMYIDLVLTRHTRSAAISLPLAGEVDLWAFQPTAFPPGENLIEILEGAVRITEGFIGAPFPHHSGHPVGPDRRGLKQTTELEEDCIGAGSSPSPDTRHCLRRSRR